MGSQICCLNLGFCSGEVMLAQLYCAYCFLSQQVNYTDQRYERVQNCFSSATKSQDRRLNVPAIGAIKSTGNIVKFFCLATCFFVYY